MGDEGAAAALINRSMTIVIVLELAEKEIELESIQDGDQLKKERTPINCPRPISIIFHLLDPSCFSLVTTYNFCSPISLVQGHSLPLFKDFFHGRTLGSAR